jgi:IS605 OrfB family transposase
LNQKQKDILKRWCYAYSKMYNTALHLLKNTYDKKQKLTINYQKLRTYHLKEKRDSIITDSICKKYGSNTAVKTHMLDSAIQLVCANYKSAITNYKKNNIKKFRMRYWRNKKLYRLDIEPSYIKDNGICPNILGKIKAQYDGDSFQWNTIRRTSQLQYDVINNTFHLLVPEIRDTESIPDRNQWIALDPGVRTFLTGISSKNVIKIGDNLSSGIMKNLKKIDTISSLPITNEKRKKLLNRLKNKLKNKIEDMHWKTANYLVKNYETILIGDMSAKSVVRGKRKGLHSNVKRTLMTLSLYKFHLRLQYKALQYHSKVIVVNEAYTSKVCSCCGHLNANIGSNHIFHCDKCQYISDRDIDGARCIAIKGLL